MKLKVAKSQTPNHFNNVVYVINNTPSTKKRQYKKKTSINNSQQDTPTQQLSDNRFLNSSNLGTEIQRANLNLIENATPQLRMNQPNVPLIENNYDQKLLQIQNALQQQIENTRFGMNYLYSRFDSSQPTIDEPNENDNIGTFAETQGSDYFVNEGDTKPDFTEPTPNINDINQTPEMSDSEMNTINVKSKKIRIKPKTTGFMSPKLPVTNEEFNEVPIEEPSYFTPKKKPEVGKMESLKLELREQYKTLGGQDTHMLNSPLKHLSVIQMRKSIEQQQKINHKIAQYKANGGSNSDILKSGSLSKITDAIKELLRQNNAQKKV
jgi:hypothetical protein